jgi:hypothetical protein
MAVWPCSACLPSGTERLNFIAFGLFHAGEQGRWFSSCHAIVTGRIRYRWVSRGPLQWHLETVEATITGWSRRHLQH